NAIMEEARAFADRPEKSLAVTVYFEPEYYSSVEARRLAEEARGRSDMPVDAMAAAVILNRYLERIRE
ncbi:MAG: Holliday junction resolvase RuvX, partial [Patescibacteria group bacterium]|nr:Holliday junction resolvase RuvX [Patescibacteria group bacterium]